MLVPLAQLHCAIELAALPPGEAPEAEGSGVVHRFELQNALTGAALAPSEAAALVPRALGPDGRVLAVTREVELGPSTLRRSFALPEDGTYRVVIEGSRRYFGCEAELPAEGPRDRRVFVALLPRAREVALQVRVHRDGDERALADAGLAAVELRPAAAREREVLVHRGMCSGERPPRGSVWCVQALTERPEPVELVARAPGYGLVTLTLDPRSSEQIVALPARYDGHVTPAATLRVGAAAGVHGGAGVGYLVAVEAAAPGELHGQTCPLAQGCVRVIGHAALASLPYERGTVLLGPGSLRSPDGTTAGTLGVMEVGAGVTVVLPATGDRARVTVLGAGLLASRGAEIDAAHGNLRLSPATTVLGVAGELLAAVRLVSGFVLLGGARAVLVPNIGSAGRRFSVLGDAGVAPETASLLHVALTFGLGVEL